MSSAETASTDADVQVVHNPTPNHLHYAVTSAALARDIDIARIPGLSGIKEKDGKNEIGAATTHHAVATAAGAW